MSLSSKLMLACRSLQVNCVRYGHQMSTKNVCHAPKPKHRGFKRKENDTVTAGEILVTQLNMRILPGMNVKITWNRNLVALADGKVKITSEQFNPNFDNPFVMKVYGNQRGQTMYKKYINVIPHPQTNRFKLVEVV